MKVLLIILAIVIIVSGLAIWFLIARNKKQKTTLVNAERELRVLRYQKAVCDRSIKYTAEYLEKKRKNRADRESLEIAIKEAECENEVYSLLRNVVDGNNGVSNSRTGSNNSRVSASTTPRKGKS